MAAKTTKPKAISAKPKKGELFDCPGCGRRKKYDSKGLCAACGIKRRKAEQQEPNHTCRRCGNKYYAACDTSICPHCGVSRISPDDLPTGPVDKDSAVYPDLDQDVAEVKESFGKVPNADGEAVSFGVDPLVHMALRDAWYEVERKALTSLSGLNPASALVRAANLVQRIQALEP